MTLEEGLTAALDDEFRARMREDYWDDYPLTAEGIDPFSVYVVRERGSVLSSIPLAGELNSLNVATATAVACFEVVRVRGRSTD